jgi:hypothetical protein
MNDITITVLLAILLLAIIAAIILIPYFINLQNKKAFEIIKLNIELTRFQLTEDRKEQNEKVFSRVMLQAHERLVLFLERIKPANLVTRSMKPQLSSVLFKTTLLNNIREEYEHNMSQQLYISNKVWDMVKTAKEDVIMLINTSADKMSEEATSAELAQEILTKGFSGDANPIDKAMNALKDELKKTFK